MTSVIDSIAAVVTVIIVSMGLYIAAGRLGKSTQGTGTKDRKSVV